jgi:threonine/homoserine/homoserine lactone efflux protein
LETRKTSSRPLMASPVTHLRAADSHTFPPCRSASCRNRCPPCSARISSRRPCRVLAHVPGSEPEGGNACAVGKAQHGDWLGHDGSFLFLSIITSNASDDDNLFDPEKQTFVRWSINHRLVIYPARESKHEQLETFLTLIAFAFVAAGTPGPNTMMLFTSGVNFGFRNTLPHMFGIGVGFLALVLGIGFGLGALLTTLPALYLVLKDPGWRLSRLHRLAHRHIRHPAGWPRPGPRPMTLLEAAAFQWVNPKAWVMLVTAMGIYTDPDHYADTVMMILLAFTIALMPVRLRLGRFRLGAAVLAVRSGPAQNGSISQWRCCWWRASGRCCDRPGFLVRHGTGFRPIVRLPSHLRMRA